MPPTQVLFYREIDGTVPIRDWLDHLPGRAQAKCLARLKRLEDLGHELRRPEADYLRDGIDELGVGLEGVHHRMLYFFSGGAAAVVSHGLIKRRAVPAGQIDLAVERKQNFERDPQSYTE